MRESERSTSFKPVAMTKLAATSTISSLVLIFMTVLHAIGGFPDAPRTITCSTSPMIRHKPPSVMPFDLRLGTNCSVKKVLTARMSGIAAGGIGTTAPSYAHPREIGLTPNMSIRNLSGTDFAGTWLAPDFFSPNSFLQKLISLSPVDVCQFDVAAQGGHLQRGLAIISGVHGRCKTQIWRRLAHAECLFRVKGGIALVRSEKTASGSRSRRGAHEIARKPARPQATRSRLQRIRWASQECLLSFGGRPPHRAPFGGNGARKPAQATFRSPTGWRRARPRSAR